MDELHDLSNVLPDYLAMIQLCGCSQDQELGLITKKAVSKILKELTNGTRQISFSGTTELLVSLLL